jgi:hypothetical protein
MENLRDIVFQAMGQVSMCWSEVPKGVFDSVQAVKIADEVMAAIEEHERASLAQAQTAWRLGHPTIIRDANGQEIARMKTTGDREVKSE